MSTSLPPPGNIGYAVLDAYGNILSVGWMLGPQFIASQPANSVALSSEQLTLVYSNPGVQYIWTNGVVQAVPMAPSIAAIQAAACTQIDSAAETCRGQFITTGLGQMLAYSAKAAEAAAFLAEYQTDAAAAAAKPNSWPFLQAEIDITGPDLWNVAMVVTAIQNGWTNIASMIEQMRLGTKAAIREASDPGKISQLVAGCAFPTAGVPVQVLLATGTIVTGGTPAVSPAPSS